MDEETRVRPLRATSVEYRLDPPGGDASAGVVLVLHGGHLRAGLPIGESALRAAGFRVLAPSRPGYGRTPTAAGPGPVEFADTVAALCDELGTGPLRAVIGHSAGGPTAVALVERHPDLTRRLVLISARSPLPFPTGATRALARIAFAPGRERWVWAGFRRLLTVSPGFGLRVMLGTLSTAPLRSVLADLGPGEREELVQVFAAMRSGSGFAVDVHHAIDPALGTGVRRPALIVASRSDGQVVWEHAERWHRLIEGSSLWESPALGHLVWFGAGAARTEQHVVNFLSGGR